MCNVRLKDRCQSGVGLIEILVVLIVIGVGLVAIVALNVDLMSGSGLAKARAEALELAREKVEELRDYAEKGQFEAALPSTSASDTPATTVNAAFTRTWEIMSVPSGSPLNTNNVKVTVSWQDPREGSQSVVLNSFISYSDPLKSGVYIAGQEAPATDLPGSKGSGKPGNGEPPSIEGEGDVLRTRSGRDTGLVEYQGQNDDGETIIELVKDGGVVYTFYGGVLKSIEGIIYYDESDINIGDIAVYGTEPSYCIYPLLGTTPVDLDRVVDEDGNVLNSGNGTADDSAAEYICYFSGDTTGTWNGGWYGKVGLGGIVINPLKTVCTGDTASDNLTPARRYQKERYVDGKKTGLEGVNRSYACHNYIVAKITNPDISEGCAQIAQSTEVNLADELHPVETDERWLIGNDAANTSNDQMNVESCTTRFISGDIDGGEARVIAERAVFDDDGNVIGYRMLSSCVDSEVPEYMYICTVPTDFVGRIVATPEIPPDAEESPYYFCEKGNDGWQAVSFPNNEQVMYFPADGSGVAEDIQLCYNEPVILGGIEGVDGVDGDEMISDVSAEPEPGTNLGCRVVGNQFGCNVEANWGGVITLTAVPGYEFECTDNGGRPDFDITFEGPAYTEHWVGWVAMCEKRVTLSGSISNLSPDAKPAVDIDLITLGDGECEFTTNSYECSVPFSDEAWSGSLGVVMNKGVVCSPDLLPEWSDQPSGNLGDYSIVVASSYSETCPGPEVTTPQ